MLNEKEWYSVLKMGQSIERAQREGITRSYGQIGPSVEPFEQYTNEQGQILYRPRNRLPPKRKNI